MSVEPRRAELPAGSGPGPGSMRDRARMENKQRLGRPLMGTEIFNSEPAWVVGGVMPSIQPGSLGTRRGGSGCREPSLLKVIF